MAPMGGRGEAVYIVKPDGGSQGRGIWLTNDLAKLQKCAAESRTKNEYTAVQRSNTGFQRTGNPSIFIVGHHQ